MDKITEKMIEQAREAETLKDVEKTLESMSNETCVGFLEKLIKDVNAMNYHSDGEYIMLQAVLMRAKEVIENA
jgi:hypothetical protein